MICQVYAKRDGVLDTLKYSHTGDAVYIETDSGKSIVLSPQAYVLNNDGTMTQVVNLVVGTPLHNVGRVRKLAMYGGRHMMFTEEHKTTKVNGFTCALWRREVL